MCAYRSAANRLHFALSSANLLSEQRFTTPSLCDSIAKGGFSLTGSYYLCDMLAICIPVYNFDVRPLVRTLHEQIESLTAEVELILIDDHSTPHYRALTQEVSHLAQYHPLPENIGRSRIRNLFLEYTEQPYLLFLDCDSGVLYDGFVLRYLTAITARRPPVICGGTTYTRARPPRERLLRWRYGHARESIPVHVRQLRPNASLMTNNFAIAREVLQEIPFEEELQHYGHEDTLLGYRLQTHGHLIYHISNPVQHDDLELNEAFLRKTEIAVGNLHKIVELVESPERLYEDIKLLRAYRLLRQLRVVGLVRMGFKLTRPALRAWLVRGTAPLWIMDGYKLGLLVSEEIRR